MTKLANFGNSFLLTIFFLTNQSSENDLFWVHFYLFLRQKDKTLWTLWQISENISSILIDFWINIFPASSHMDIKQILYMQREKRSWLAWTMLLVLSKLNADYVHVNTHKFVCSKWERPIWDKEYASVWRNIDCT